MKRNPADGGEPRCQVDRVAPLRRHGAAFLLEPELAQHEAIDLVLLIQQGLPSGERVLNALRATFQRRGTHALPKKLDSPPENWRDTYATLAAEYDVNPSTIEAAYARLSDYWKTLGVS